MARSAAAADCFSGTLNGEGSTAQKNAIEAAIKAYQTACSDATINYNATGSGAGIKQFTGKQVDFAGSDSALKTDEATAAKTACGSDAWNLPMVAGPIAIAYNVKGVSNLVLNADVAAKIFNGVVTTWNDPAITALNSGATLPAAPIKVFFRSDESGTTENFTNYLKAAAPDRLDRRPRQEVDRQGRGQGEVGRRLERGRLDRRRRHLHRVVLRHPEQAGHRQDRQRLGHAGRADR